jgi:sulfatase maturation enzyme AslB (radical SAM superfamily)
MGNLYCSIIHSGLDLTIKESNITAQHCCLRNDRFSIDINTDYWNDPGFISLRDTNKQNVWAPGCENCQSLEAAGQTSLRLGANSGLQGDLMDLTGPKKIDLQFDISCNLACRSCGPQSSTLWQKHLKENGEWDRPIGLPPQHENVIKALEKLNLSNLQMLVFAGGETLLGQSYWEITKWLADNVPNAKQQLTLCFQTNGTQPIHPRNYELIDRFHLVRLHVSLDGIKEKFEYLRWPANWNQVTDNIMHIRETAPSNVMFHIEETVSIFNLFYQSELEDWVIKNFSANREGDKVTHNRHLAIGVFGLANCTQEYVDAMQNKQSKSLIPQNWKEIPSGIARTMHKIRKFDNIRNESFQEIFPEVAEFYTRYMG